MRIARSFALLVLAAALPARAADLERVLNARWQGAWVVLTTPVWSDCDERYTNDEVVAGRATGDGVRFDPGELAQVHKLGVKRTRLEVLVDLDEGFLLPRRDGPYTLYDDAHCRVELLIDVPREVVRTGDAKAAEAVLAPLVERYDREGDARASATWNRRRKQPLPPGYERTLAEYQTWKAAQVNGAIQERLDHALDDAARVSESLRDDPAYLDGFAAGAQQARGGYFGDCDWLLSSSFFAFKHSPGRGEREWKQGYDDGQLLVFSVEVARRLRGCFVPPPPAGR
jgi:hypothetical protein